MLTLCTVLSLLYLSCILNSERGKHVCSQNITAVTVHTKDEDGYYSKPTVLMSFLVFFLNIFVTSFHVLWNCEYCLKSITEPSFLSNLVLFLISNLHERTLKFLWRPSNTDTRWEIYSPRWIRPKPYTHLPQQHTESRLSGSACTDAENGIFLVIWWYYFSCCLILYSGEHSQQK